ncbi:MAG: UDP-N-acetylmuramoyl-tripeptide--D-alanyl-D-alanine ligase [Bdellovibrionota bacterium]
MNFLTLHWIAKALGQTPPAKDAPVSLLSSDTREIKPGALFVALKGENADGHDFVEKAKAAGATALIHRKDFKAPAGMISFPVEDTLAAYRLLAKAWRKEFKMPVIAVAGSAGKTTSKEMLAAILRGKWKNVLQTQGSQNGFQGVPTTLLRLRPDQDAAVIEVGIDEPHSMIQHLDLVAPDAGLLSSIGPEHLEKLIDLDTVEKEEGFLFEFLEKAKGLAAVNNDDERIRNQAKLHLKSARKLTYGIDRAGELRGYTVNQGDDLYLDVENLRPGLAERFKVPLEGLHNARNLLGAIALAHGLGLTTEEMQKGIATFTPPPGRSEVHEWRGCKVLADTYNANPASVEAALDTLFATKRAGETWVCLGDMLELGTLEESMHRGLADPILKHDVRHVLLYGPRMQKLAAELKARGHQDVKHFSTQEAMAEAIRKQAKSGDRILLKGSRGMRMENVWKALQA